MLVDEDQSLVLYAARACQTRTLSRHMNGEKTVPVTAPRAQAPIPALRGHFNTLSPIRRKLFAAAEEVAAITCRPVVLNASEEVAESIEYGGVLRPAL